MKILILRANGEYGFADATPDKYTQIVGGWLQPVSRYPSIACYVRLDAKENNMPYNTWSYTLLSRGFIEWELYGDIIVCSCHPNDGVDIDIMDSTVKQILEAHHFI